MRNVLLIAWLLVPIGAWAFHEGPGQHLQALETTDAVLVAAHAAAVEGRWSHAIEKYEEALTKLPKDERAIPRSTTQRLQLELNKARMQARGLPIAREELAVLVEEMAAEPDADAALLREAREALAHAQFYTTWLMRLGGLHREAWEPEIEAARQNWRLLAEQTDGDAAARHRADLEASIRLARIDIEDLQGLPLPGE